MTAWMKLRVVGATHELVLSDVTHIRFDTTDGSLGVLPGHERATARLRPGAIVVRQNVNNRENESFIATEGGMAIIGPPEVVLVTSWAEHAPDIESLASQVRRRTATREKITEKARALGQQYDLSVRRALMGLKREVNG